MVKVMLFDYSTGKIAKIIILNLIYQILKLMILLDMILPQGILIMLIQFGYSVKSKIEL